MIPLFLLTNRFLLLRQSPHGVMILKALPWFARGRKRLKMLYCRNFALGPLKESKQAPIPALGLHDVPRYCHEEGTTVSPLQRRP